MPRCKSFSGAGESLTPNVGVYSYPTKKSPNSAGQFEFDVSNFRDPAGQKQFSQAPNGLAKEVVEWVRQDRRVPIIVKDCILLAEDLVRLRPDGRSTCGWLSFGFKDYHGKWIAPAVAEAVAESLSEAGFNVATHHSCNTVMGDKK